ncbi:hypothetical protein PBY51_016182 [Eleginops maclovinus]|uniref:Uncharacterized protein n=1 Tax=Eleginops maclovinus TaxID=56733 RepID=A0AAN8AJK3_ELEMC|nr:hypothetical protein PBY51_016182 [Eleginops maclovinus]
MAGLSPSPPSLPQSGHLSSCGCPSNAFKWVKPSTSASAPWDTAQASVLQRHTTTGQRGSVLARPHKAEGLIHAELGRNRKN